MAIRIDGIEYDAFTPSLGGGGGFVSSSPLPTVAPAPPSNLREFDLSPISGLSRAQRFGSNLVGDIQDAYETYISGSSVGRGGQYARDAQQEYGYSSLSQAAAVYLQAAGLKLKDTVAPTLDIFKPEPVATTTPQFADPDVKEDEFFGLPVPPLPTVEKAIEAIKTPIEILADVFQKAFGQAVYNPPLQSQATSYTPVPGAGAVSAGGSGGVGVWLIIGGIAIAAYFVYKRLSGG